MTLTFQCHESFAKLYRRLFLDVYSRLILNETPIPTHGVQSNFVFPVTGEKGKKTSVAVRYVKIATAVEMACGFQAHTCPPVVAERIIVEINKTQRPQGALLCSRAVLLCVLCVSTFSTCAIRLRLPHTESKRSLNIPSRIILARRN